KEDGKRNFALRENGNETSVFSGNTPRQAAMKAARRLDPVGSEKEAKNNPTRVRLREKGTDRIHVYDAWAWEEEPPEDGPDWLTNQDTVTEANVSKVGVEHED
ncbi:MAG: non-histone chromosomal MC1 family protein, partial [Halobacteriaceae archaeon]